MVIPDEQKDVSKKEISDDQTGDEGFLLKPREKDTVMIDAGTLKPTSKP